MFDANPLWVVVIGVLPTMLGLVAGVGFAPLCAITCALLARRRGLEARRYALAGGLYSVAFLMPGIYLMAVLAGLRPPKALIALAYLAAATVWAAGSVGTPALQLWLVIEYDSGVTSLPWVIEAALIIFVIGVNISLMLKWAQWFTKRRPAPSLSPLPQTGYVVPFALVPSGFLLFLVLTGGLL